MTTAVPQRSVTITLSGSSAADARVSYSYWSPNSGLSYTNSPNCDLLCKTATDTLFLLDYASTGAGWTIVNTTPNPATAPTLEQWLGPAAQSLMTYNPCITVGTFNFFINYVNVVTGAVVSFDPQEGNEPG